MTKSETDETGKHLSGLELLRGAPIAGGAEGEGDEGAEGEGAEGDEGDEGDEETMSEEHGSALLDASAYRLILETLHPDMNLDEERKLARNGFTIGDDGKVAGGGVYRPPAGIAGPTGKGARRMRRRAGPTNETFDLSKMSDEQIHKNAEKILAQ